MIPSGIGADVYAILAVQVVSLAVYLHWVQRRNRADRRATDGGT